MPTLHIQLTEGKQPVTISQDISAQHMRLKSVIYSGMDPSGTYDPTADPQIILPIAQQVHANDFLVDLTDLGASTREITGFCKHIGENFYLVLPGFNASTPGLPLVNNEGTLLAHGKAITRVWHPNLGFDTGTVPRTFSIRTLVNLDDGCPQCPFYDQPDPFGASLHTGLQQIDLYFEYGSNDNPAN